MIIEGVINDSEISKLKEHFEENFSCNKDFRCLEHDSRVCEVRTLGFEKYFYCLDYEKSECLNSINFGGGRVCTCPIRLHLANEYIMYKIF